MFNVQTSDLIDESRTSQKYSSAVDAQLQEMQKTLLFAYIEGQINYFEKALEEAKASESKMMTIFKFPNLTLLTSTVFNTISQILSQSISLINAKKTLENLPSQYTLFFALRLL
jgi:hypothetical protein